MSVEKLGYLIYWDFYILISKTNLILNIKTNYIIINVHNQNQNQTIFKLKNLIIVFIVSYT